MAEKAGSEHGFRLVFKLKETSEKLLLGANESKADIPMVPAGLWDVGRGNGYLFVPRVVALDPHHRSNEAVSGMEEVKVAAAAHFCNASGSFTDEVYKKIVSVAAKARRCYTGADVDCDEEAFAAMMLVDGCFLLEFIAMYTGKGSSATSAPSPLSRLLLKSHVDTILRDVMLLENQLPWVVLEQLMAFRPAPVDQFLGKLAESFVARKDVATPKGLSFTECKPPHLLGLFVLRQLGPMPEQILGIDTTPISTFSTAVELAEMGVKITGNRSAQFGDMSAREGVVFRELALAPVFLNDLTASWLVNMIAHEVRRGACSDYHGVISYASLLALLMNQGEDVQELRARRVLHSTFSDDETLSFFKGLALQLHFSRRYYRIFEDLEEYQQKRWLWICVHRFVYRNFRAILAVLFSLIGIVVPIPKAVLSLKQHQHQG